MLDFIKGYKTKLLGLVWVAFSVVDGLGGIDILKSVDASNWLDNVMFGIGVFSGRDALDSLFDKIKKEAI
mgnify:CR=1 FL=1|jgi:hypothetical protein